MEEEQSMRISVERTSSESKSGQRHGTHSTSGAGAPVTALPSKRRRGPGFVTPNACNECKKRRVKCDGKSPCSRCKSQKNVDCVYEVPVRRSKENLRHEIECLRKQQRQSNRVFSALGRPELQEEVLQRLRSGQSVAAISESLDRIAASSTVVLSNYAQPAEPKSGVISAPPYVGSQGGYGSGAANQAAMQTPMVKQDVDQLDMNSPWSSLSQSRPVSQQTTTHPDMDWASEGSTQSIVGSWLQNDDGLGGQAKYPGMNHVLAIFDPPEIKVPHSTWTNVTDDSALVHHLLALYFCWEYPTFASLSKEHFLRDYLSGRHRYCSPILVNALLALGCRFSTQPETRANPNDPRTSGDHFFSESLRLLYKETKHHTLTTIQALGIMSIREASCGRDSESWYYAGQSVRLAIEMGLHQLNADGDEDELAVQGATFWGAFALDHAWSLATGSLPRSSQFLHMPPKPAIIDAIEVSLWMPYTDDGAPHQRSCEQPSNVRSVYKCFCELSELVHQCLYVLHSPGRPPTSRDLLNVYTQYLNWYDSIPAVLRLGQNFTPAVLFAHMYYHFAILLLFRPLIKLRIIGSAILPRDVCSQAADAIQGLLRSYSQLYTLRRTPCFVPYFLLTSAIMHLAVGASAMEPVPPVTRLNTSMANRHHTGSSRVASLRGAGDGAESTAPPIGPTMVRLSPKIAAAVKQSISDLAEMAPCHHFAEQALNILRFIAKKWNIEVDVPYQGVGGDVEKLVRPSTSSLNFFVPNVSTEDFIRAASKVPSQHGDMSRMEGMTIGETNPEAQSGSSSRRVAAAAEDALENPLFWPFPTQGRPIFPEGSQLVEAGFALL
ncbi:hypothetical protein F4861DRAFT_327664 [Xylaria intraflava]|nr:hypothetical protein F4861DRAFT_327664 [Xylaria intraflava]